MKVKVVRNLSSGTVHLVYEWDKAGTLCGRGYNIEGWGFPRIPQLYELKGFMQRHEICLRCLNIYRSGNKGAYDVDQALILG